MKKSTRIISMLLVLITVIGLLPLSLFAVGEKAAVGSEITAAEMPEAVKGKGGIADKTTLDKILRSGYVAEEDVIMFANFNGLTAGKANGETMAQQSDKNSDFFGSENTKVVVKGGSGSPAWKQLANGDIALSFSDGVATSSGNRDVYFDIVNKGLASNGLENCLALPADRSFVFQMDVKRGEKLMECAGFISAVERSGGGPNGVRLVGVDTAGRLYVSGDSSITLGYLSKDVFTTITVYVDPGENGVGGRYWVYINGVLVSEEGYAFGYNGSNPFRLNAFRIYQVHFTMNSGNTADSGNQELSADAITFDNLQSYYVADSFKPEYFVGLDNAGDRFVQGEEGIRFYKDGALLGKGTFELDGFDYTFNDNGYLVTKNLTPVVDMYGMLDVIANNGDTIYKTVSDNVNITMLARSTSVLKDGFTYEWFSNKSGRTLILPTTLLDWSDYDALEISLWTNEVEQLFTYLSLMSPTPQKAFAYYGKYVYFGDTAVTAYKSNGNPVNHGVGLGIENWYNLTVDFDGLSGSVTGTTWANIPEIRFNTVGWNLDAKFQSDKKTLAINTKDVSVHFSGFNLVKYEVVENLGDVLTEIDGKLVPSFGQIGFKEVDGLSLYYDPYSQKLVKNTTKWIAEQNMGYTFDENGVGTLANGFHVIGGDSYHFVDGVMATVDFELEGKTYKVDGNGVIRGIYGENYADWTPYAAYDGAAHDANATYITSIDFQSYAGNVYDNRGANGALSITSGSSKLNCVIKSTGARMVTEADGNVYMEFGNYYDSVDPYLNLDVTAAKPKTSTVFEFDLKLGETWNATASLFALISAADSSVSGSARVNTGGLQINPQGYVYRTEGQNLFKLSSEEFTRVSVVVDPTAKTYSVYANGVCVYTNSKYTSDSRVVNIGEFRMLQFVVKNDVSSICIDNFYVYAGNAPQKTVAATLRNGAVEENGTERFYNNGVMMSGEQNGAYYSPINGVRIAPENMNGSFGKKLYKNGELVTELGFNEVDGKLYYVSATDGSVYHTNMYVIDGNLYFFNADGSLNVSIASKEEELVSVQNFVNALSDRLEVGYDSTGAHVKFKNGVMHETRYYFDKPQNLLTKKYLEIDVYIPEEYNEVDFQFIYGTTNRYYGIKRTESAGKVTYALNNEIAYEHVLKAEGYKFVDETSANQKFTYDKISIEGKVLKQVDKDGNPTGKYYVFKKWDYNCMPSEILKLDEMTPGWNTVRVELPSASDKAYGQLKNVDFFQLNIAGWGMNTTRDWNTTGKDSFIYPDADKCDFRFSALRVGTYDACVDYSVIANAGFAEDGSYVGVNGEKLTGIQNIDGVWYVFSDKGEYEGTLNGLHKVEYYEYTEGTYVLRMENRVFVDGVMQLAKTDDGNLVVQIDEKVYLTNKDGLLVKNEIVQNDKDQYFFIDGDGEGTIANGFEADDKFYVDGYLGNGELTVDGDTEEKMYFKDGDGKSAYVVKEDGMVVYGEDGKQVEIKNLPVLITLKITKPGETETVLSFYQSYGKNFKYVPAEIDGYVAVITVNGVEADAIELDSVTENTEIVITYGAKA